MALLCVLSPLAPAAAGAVKADFGDAPDGAPARYVTAPGVIGHFPSKAGTPGPRHNPFGSFFLGAGVNGEADSAQVDKDRFDDGASVSLAKCGSSTLDVVLNGAALPPATLTSAHVAYVNAWFDWNRDGDWADSSDSCSPEWAVQNLPVSMDKLSPGGVAVLPVGFTAGGQTQDIWERVTLTLDQPISSSNGGGSASPYTQGETEDYLIPAGEEKPVIVPPLRQKKRRRARRRRARRRGRRGRSRPPKKPGKFKVSCAPDPAVIPHGGVATVKFVIVDTGKGWIFGSPSTQKGPAGKASVTPVKPQPKGVPPGFVAADGFKQSGSKVDPPLRVQTVVVKFTFTRGRQTQNLSCKVLIVHWAAGNLFLPRVVCEGACRGVPPPPKPIGTLHGGGTLQSPFLTQSFFDVFFELDVDAFKVVLPAGNQVMNPQVPPGAPYSCAPATKSTENDTLLCTGSLPANTHAQGDFHTSAPISPNSAQLYGRQPGSTTFEGPFTLSGP